MRSVSYASFLSLWVLIWICGISRTVQGFMVCPSESPRRMLSSPLVSPVVFPRTALHAVGTDFKASYRNDTATPNASNKRNKSNKKDEEPLLSEVDARVLQQMLQEDKLDLKEQKNMEKLLERGVKSKEIPTPPTPKEDDGEFSSTVFKTLANTKLWKALSRNAKDVAESVGIYVQNRIERDAKLIGALGLFAFERAMQDVGRALPAASAAASKVARKNPLLANITAATLAAQQKVLPSTSSFRQDQKADVAGDMATTLDEIKSVSEAVREIFQSSGSSQSSAAKADRRGLRNVAPAGQAKSKDRFERAFRRKQVTTLKKEKENVFDTTRRTASGVVDTAWQLKRELEVEPNKPGYRTKALREGAAKTTNQLKAGATKILEAVKRKDSERRLGGAKSVSQEQPQQNESLLPYLQNILKDEQRSLLQRLGRCIEKPEETWMRPEAQDGPLSSNIDSVIAVMVTAQADLQRNAAREDPSTSELLQSLEDAKESVTLIAKEARTAVSDSAGEALERRLIFGPDFEAGKGMPVLMQLSQLRQQATDLEQQLNPAPSSSARTGTKFGETANIQSPEAAEWRDDQSESSYLDGIIERESLEELVHNVLDAVVIETEKAHSKDGDASTGRQEDGDRPYYSDADVVEALLDTEWARTTDSDGTASTFFMEDVESPQEQQDIVNFIAELVSDDDFDQAVGVAKAVAGIDDDDTDVDEQKEPNAIISVLLRTLDIIFFVIERLFTVVLPAIMTSGGTATARLQDVRSEGLGSAGWKLIGSAQRGAKRY